MRIFEKRASRNVLYWKMCFLVKVSFTSPPDSVLSKIKSVWYQLEASHDPLRLRLHLQWLKWTESQKRGGRGRGGWFEGTSSAAGVFGAARAQGLLSGLCHERKDSNNERQNCLWNRFTAKNGLSYVVFLYFFLSKFLQILKSRYFY